MTNKVKIKPYCEWNKNKMCVNDECPLRGDYCPVPDIPGLCRYEERHEMTARKAWENIEERLKVYSHEHGFTDEDLAAEVMLYGLLYEAEDRNEKSDD